VQQVTIIDNTKANYQNRRLGKEGRRLGKQGKEGAQTHSGPLPGSNNFGVVIVQSASSKPSSMHTPTQSTTRKPNFNKRKFDFSPGW
jgi:hypothetical protein